MLTDDIMNAALVIAGAVTLTAMVVTEGRAWRMGVAWIVTVIAMLYAQGGGQ